MDITLLNDLIVKDRIKLNLHCDLKLNSIKFIKASFEERFPTLTRQKATFITFYEPDNGIFKKLNSYVLCKEYIKTWIKNIDEKTIEAMQKMNISAEEASWLVFTGIASGSTYNFEDERINILFKDGSVKDISQVDDPLIGKNLGGKIKKYYFCFLR